MVKWTFASQGADRAFLEREKSSSSQGFWSRWPYRDPGPSSFWALRVNPGPLRKWAANVGSAAVLPADECFLINCRALKPCSEVMWHLCLCHLYTGMLGHLQRCGNLALHVPSAP